MTTTKSISRSSKCGPSKGSRCAQKFFKKNFLLLSLSPGSEVSSCSILDEVLTALQKTATAVGKDAALRAQALEALVLLTFAAQEDQAEVTKTLSGLMIVAGESGELPQLPNFYLRSFSEVAHLNFQDGIMHSYHELSAIFILLQDKMRVLPARGKCNSK